jgi:hypothetical protein
MAPVARYALIRAYMSSSWSSVGRTMLAVAGLSEAKSTLHARLGRSLSCAETSSHYVAIAGLPLHISQGLSRVRPHSFGFTSLSSIK